MNDWQLSQWISQSLAGELDESQKAELQDALQRSPASQAFAQWSSRIQAAAAEMHRIESMQPDITPAEPADCLSEISKARLQRAIRNELNQPRERGEPLQPLRVAQSPDVYQGLPTHRDCSAASEQPPNLGQSDDELVRGGRALCARMTADLSNMLQTLHWTVELLSLSNLPIAATQPHPRREPPAPPASGRSIGWELLTSLIASMLHVQTSLCAISIARYQSRNFDELLRIQRGPRDLSDVRLLPRDRLRHGSASRFHRTLIEAQAFTPDIDIDRSIAGWHRIVLGVALSDPQLKAGIPNASPSTVNAALQRTLAGERWGLALVEADIERLLNTHIQTLGINARVTLMDNQGQRLFSAGTSSASSTAPVDEFTGDPRMLAQAMSQTGEIHLPERGLWGALLNCPAPLDNLRLVMQAG